MFNRLKKCIFVGTSSLRRSAQLKLNFPQLKFQVSIPLNTIIFEGLHFGLGYGLVWSMIWLGLVLSVSWFGLVCVLVWSCLDLCLVFFLCLGFFLGLGVGRAWVLD